MKRCPKCNNDFPDDANFCPVDAGHLVPVEGTSDGTPVDVPRVDTGGHELLDGRFALGDIIGGHHTGPVYQAGDKQGSSAMVKLVNADVFPSTLLKQRTERELKQLERLEHPGVARVLGHGRREDQVWIATERVDGMPLSQFISENGPLPQAESIAILAQIGTALEAAAKLGVTHRDLAPKNVLITSERTIKLINFGVPVPGPQGRAQVQGVPEFVAPEQIDGRPVDQRCNIYSLGAIGYVLLTGSPPFQGTPEEVYAAHNRTDVTALGPEHGVSPELSAVLLKSLEKTSSKRFMTLRQFLGDLGNAEAGGAQAGGAQATASRRPIEANQTLMGVAAISLEGMVAGKRASVGTPAPMDAGATARDHSPPEMSQPGQPPTVIESYAGAVTATPLSEVGFAPTDMSPMSARVEAQPQPAPAQPAPPQPVAAVQAPSGKKRGAPQAAPQPTAKKGAFRETMWFKKGELDEAAAAAAASTPEGGGSDKVDLMEMDVRYNDDGSISKQDQERLSLRTGATMMMQAVAQQDGGQNQVSERDLVSEMTAGRNKILMIMAAVVVAVGVALALLLN